MINQKKILVVEDAPQVANILLAKLTREGHSVTWKRNREQALRACEEVYDLILLSTDVPERNAWQILSDLRGAHSSRVVMLLETDEAPLEPQAMQSGATGVIIKPFKPTRVAKQVRDWLLVPPSP